MSPNDAEAYLGRQTKRRTSRVWTAGCLVSLWVIGGFATVVFAVMVAFGSAWSCSDTQGLNDTPQDCDTSPWPLIVFGFGVITLITAVVVLAQRKKWRAIDAGGTVPRRS